MPLSPRARIGWDRRSQSLKSPMTWTALARGAQTAKDTPQTSPSGSGVVPHVRPEDGPQLLVAALVDEVPVDLAEGRRETVRVVLLVLDAVAVLDEQAVVVRRA